MLTSAQNISLLIKFVIFSKNNVLLHWAQACTIKPFTTIKILQLGKLVCLSHRDKTRVKMPAKMFPPLKLICLLFMGPTLGFDTKKRNSFFDQIWCFFYNKSKIVTILFIVKYEKSTLFDEFLVLLGPIISSFFACSNEEKK